MDLAVTGAPRLGAALDFTGEGGGFQKTIERERSAWSLYYDMLDSLETTLAAGDAEAEAIRERAVAIVDGTRLNGPAV